MPQPGQGSPVSAWNGHRIVFGSTDSSVYPARCSGPLSAVAASNTHAAMRSGSVLDRLGIELIELILVYRVHDNAHAEQRQEQAYQRQVFVGRQ